MAHQYLSHAQSILDKSQILLGLIFIKLLWSLGHPVQYWFHANPFSMPQVCRCHRCEEGSCHTPGWWQLYGRYPTRGLVHCLWSEVHCCRQHDHGVTGHFDLWRSCLCTQIYKWLYRNPCGEHGMCSTVSSQTCLRMSLLITLEKIVYVACRVNPHHNVLCNILLALWALNSYLRSVGPKWPFIKIFSPLLLVGHLTWDNKQIRTEPVAIFLNIIRTHMLRSCIIKMKIFPYMII